MGLTLRTSRVVITVILLSSAYAKELTLLSYRNDFWVAAAELKEQRELDFINFVRDFNAGRGTDRMAYIGYVNKRA